jgi:hypothetical protein
MEQNNSEAECFLVSHEISHILENPKVHYNVGFEVIIDYKEYTQSSWLKVASISQLTVSRVSRQCGILNISQRYRPPKPVKGIALLCGDAVCFL